jgi:hypothetical protein
MVQQSFSGFLFRQALHRIDVMSRQGVGRSQSVPRCSGMPRLR